MDLMQLWTQFNAIGHASIIGVLIILTGMIKIPKIELNIWSWLFRFIGRAINGEIKEQLKALDTKINNIQTEVQQMQKEEELERVRDSRQRILRFNDDILCGKKRSKEHFDEILLDITTYEHYCNTHKDYENDKAILAIETVREVYKECLRTHDFLTKKKKKG